MRRLAHGLIVGILAVVVLTAGAGVASAHALLSSSDPADGVSLPKAPSEIRLTFTESPDPALSTILVLDSGDEAPGRSTDLAAAAHTDGVDTGPPAERGLHG